MASNKKTVEPEHVTCRICLKEIPVSEAIVPEASDYVAHFCGAQCYDKWRNQPAAPENLLAARDPV